MSCPKPELPEFFKNCSKVYLDEFCKNKSNGNCFASPHTCGCENCSTICGVRKGINDCLRFCSEYLKTKLYTEDSTDNRNLYFLFFIPFFILIALVYIVKYRKKIQDWCPVKYGGEQEKGDQNQQIRENKCSTYSLLPDKDKIIEENKGTVLSTLANNEGMNDVESVLKKSRFHIIAKISEMYK